MSRTAFFRESPGLARTRFHAHRDLQPAQIRAEITNLNNTLSGKLETTQLTLGGGIVRLGNQLGMVEQKVGKLDLVPALDQLQAELGTLDQALTTRIEIIQNQLSNRIEGLDNNLAELRNSDILWLERTVDVIRKDTTALVRWLLARPPLVAEQTEKVYLCLRALNRVEDLIIDKDFRLRQNNAALNRIATDKLTEGALAFLEDSPELQEVFRNLCNPFDKATVLEERNERFWTIQELRRAIIHYFASQPEVAQDSSPLTDQAGLADS